MPRGLSPAARVMAFFANVSLPEAEQMFELVKETLKVRRLASAPVPSPRRSHKKAPRATPPVSEATPLGTKRPRRTKAQMIADALVPQTSNLPGNLPGVQA